VSDHRHGKRPALAGGIYHLLRRNPEVGGTVTIQLERRKTSVPRVAGETLLESARRAGLAPPFSCEAGNCGTCMGRLTEGSATMRANNVLEDDEIADGYILTCQGVPDTPSVTVYYE
jgi:3-ketosteroid 9alpha-monooxygenase subunit B